MALNNADLFLVNQGGQSKKITYQNLKLNILEGRVSGGPLAGFRNQIINGDFRINLRGGTRTPGVGVYGFDRWKGHADGLEQIIEALPAGEFTLSWTGGGNGTFGGTTAVSPITETVAGGETSVVVPSDATDVQLEPGPVATPFELRPIGIELMLCERYYQSVSLDGIVYNANSDVVTARIVVPLKTAMRVSSPEYASREGRQRIRISNGAYSNTTSDSFVAIPSISGCNEPLGTLIVNVNRVADSGQNFVTIVGSNVETQFNLDAEI